MNALATALEQFHFLRPFWLLACVPALILFILLWRQRAYSGEWKRAIAPHLLAHLMHGSQTRDTKTPLLLLLSAWLLASVAMAGPTWEKLPAALKKKADARVIVLDLTLSMLSSDTPPSRLTRAKHKLSDILTRSKEGVNGLVVFAGSAHVVSPLTDDSNTILSLASSLTPEIMPISGSDPIDGIKKAHEVLQAGGFPDGQILFIGDDLPANYATALEPLKGSISLSILALGTSEGAPIMVGNGRYLKDASGSIVMAPVDFSRLQQASALFGGRYSAMTADDSDIDLLLADFLNLDDNVRETQREFDIWDDAGGWIALLLLPLAAASYRKGWLGAWMLPLLLSVTLMQPPSARAESFEAQEPDDSQAISPSTESSEPQDSSAVQLPFSSQEPSVSKEPSAPHGHSISDESSGSEDFLSSLWKNDDQRAKDRFDQQHYDDAAKQFQDPAWKAGALYKSGKYTEAEELYKNLPGADAHYNRGNALAQQGKFDDAIKAYDEALKLNPDMADAKANQETVRRMKQQQPPPQQGGDGKQGDSDKQDQDKQPQNKQDQNNQDKQNQNQQESDQSSQDQQQGDNPQQNNDQQNGDQANNKSSKGNQEQDEAQKEPNDKKGKGDKKDADEKQNEQAEAEQQQAAGDKGADEEKQGTEMPTSPDAEGPETEDQQAMEQWLRRVPDDPGGLLRRKFYYESRLRRNNENQNGTQW